MKKGVIWGTLVNAYLYELQFAVSRLVSSFAKGSSDRVI